MFSLNTFNWREEEDKKELFDSYTKRIEKLQSRKEFYLRSLELIEREKEIKGKAPLPVESERKYEYENLPEWEEHYRNAINHALEDEKMKIDSEIFQIDTQIEKIHEMRDEL